MLAWIKYYASILIDPVFLTRHRLRRALLRTLIPLDRIGLKCLDVGCGSRPYEGIFINGCYEGVDVQSSGRPLSMKMPDKFYDGATLPYAENSFDLVMSTQVLEHVPDPLALIFEMVRVCKNGGEVVLSLPFVYPEHEQPYDYLRFTSYGVAELLERAGLKVIQIKRDSSAIETLAVLLNVYMVNNFIPPWRGIGRLFALLFCFPVQLLVLMISKFLPDNGTLYLNLVVHARKE
jgi:SAM-dependent methyltransferase